MNAVKVISLAVLLLFIPGCKITQIVPAEGAIVSRTGTHDCAAGQTCIIDVPGVPFSDTFTAVPNPGYRFVQWKKQSGSLCWGSTNPICALEGISTELTSLNNDMPLLPVFEKIDLLKLLPAATRGVFQIDPGAPGAIDTGAADSTWSSSPLDVLENYSAGMELADNAQRIVLAQLADTPDQFILLAKLGTSDVDTLSSVLDLTNAGTYRGYQRWSIDGTDLQLAKIDSVILAIAPQAALQLALDAYTGAGAAIATGPLGSYLAGLNIGQPNNVVYALPALYGAVPAPGSGTASLSQARVLSSSFSVTGDALSGSLVFYTSNASTYATKLTTQLTGYPTPAITGFGSVLAHVSLNGLSVENDLRPLLKTLILDMDTVDYTAAVVHGGNKPWLNFNVGTDPAALFVNFEFAGPAEVAAFEAAHLPPGFHLVPFRMVETDTLRHIMVLNMYQSSGGLVSGARAEWAVFVADPDSGEPRFMVVEALAESLTADSVTPGFLSFGSPVSYALNSSEIVGHVGVGTHATTYFSVNIPWPQLPSTYVPFAREFMPSNDFVFWGNAVADKTLFNSTAVNRNASVIPPGQFTFVDNSPWAAFVNEDPLHAVVYLNNQELAISPWWNLDATYLNVSPQLRQDLINFKNGFYPLTVQGNAQAAIRGLGVVPTQFTTADSVPTAYYHFPLLDPEGLLNAVSAPGTFTPMAVELFEDEPAAHYLTLAVYKRENDPCGIRAEWVTYVVGSAGRPESVRLDSLAAQSCLDPVSLLGVATELSQSITGDTLSTQVSSPFTRFEATVDLSGADAVLTGLNWLEANERVCSLNNICDEFYYDGELVTIPAERADTVATVVTTVETPWNAYIDANGVRAGVRQNPSIQAINAWRNLRPFAGTGPAP